jgi:hypothetical protein
MEQTIGPERVATLIQKRAGVLSAMQKSEEAGRVFSKHWGRLGNDLRATLEGSAPSSHQASNEAVRVAEYWCELDSVAGSVETRLQALPGRVRSFFAAAPELKKANDHLGFVMRELIIRHRRDTEFRRYRVGHEYPSIEGNELRPDQHQLHTARGSELPSNTELAQFLLMKVVASATHGRRKAALGMDITGAYSTLWNSNEGRKAVAAAEKNEAESYFRLLGKLTGGHGLPNRADRSHPKVSLAVQTALDCWKRDEKTLIFCFRIQTATVLRDLISNEIEQHIASVSAVDSKPASGGRIKTSHFFSFKPVVDVLARGDLRISRQIQRQRIGFRPIRS